MPLNSVYFTGETIQKKINLEHLYLPKRRNNLYVCTRKIQQLGYNIALNVYERQLVTYAQRLPWCRSITDEEERGGGGREDFRRVIFFSVTKYRK